MEKINITKLLKDCPSGMELNCAMYEDVYFDYVDELNIIHCYIKHETHKTSITFNQHGTPNSDIKSKCVIFPKDKTTWEGFVPPINLKNGDVVVDDSGAIFIYKQIHTYYEEPYADFYCGLSSQLRSFIIKTGEGQRCGKIDSIRLATEEEKQELFDAIKAKGYKWNPETKTLEKLPKFKIGDEIARKNGISNSFIVNSVSREFYGLRLPDNTGIGVLRVDEQDDWELISRVKPIFKKGDKVRVKKGVPEPRIARIIEDVGDTFYTLVSFGKIDFTDQDNWELVPNKFDVTTLKPFTKVLVRDFDNETWEINFFSKLLDGKHFKCLDLSYVQCIPYEGNEHLYDTTNKCDDFYKIWEK